MYLRDIDCNIIIITPKKKKKNYNRYIVLRSAFWLILFAFFHVDKASL